MRKRRTDAKTRVAIRAFLAGKIGAVEICQFLVPRLSWDDGLLDATERRFVEDVADNLSGALLASEWHPDFVDQKLKSLALYEASVRNEVEQICQRILMTMETRKAELKL